MRDPQVACSGGIFLKKVKGISTSFVRANVDKLHTIPHFERYELTFFRDNDLPALKEFLASRKASFGLHAPFVYRYVNHHPYPTSLDKELRRDTFYKNFQCLKFAESLGADYVVVHFPTALQKENWYSDYFEIIDEFKTLKECAKVQLRIENVYGNDFFYNCREYKDFLKKTELKMCLDIGHLLLDCNYYKFDPLEFIYFLKDFIVEFHIYYASFETYHTCHHKAWSTDFLFLEILDVIKDFDAEFVLEPSPECLEDFEKALEYLSNI